MTRIRVCSGFSPSGKKSYGDRFLATFDRHWPKSVELVVYVEEQTPMPRGAERILWDIPGAREFHHRHADNLAAQGREPRPCWKPRELVKGYSFRTDAGKFWKQIVIPQAASLDEKLGPLEDGDILIWLDGDVVTTRDVPEDFIQKTLGDADVAFLGREPKWSEIGFWAIRISPITLEFLSLIARMYTEDRVFKLPHWHSAFVWDYVRRQLNLSERNLTRPGTRGHVWPHSVLGRYMVHDKGGRKPK